MQLTSTVAVLDLYWLRNGGESITNSDLDVLSSSAESLGSKN